VGEDLSRHCGVLPREFCQGLAHRHTHVSHIRLRAKRGTTWRVLGTFTCESKPESGLDCFICMSSSIESGTNDGFGHGMANQHTPVSRMSTRKPCSCRAKQEQISQS